VDLLNASQLANVRVLAATLRGLRTHENKREGLMVGTPIRLLVAGCLVIAASAPLIQSTTTPVRASGTCGTADTAVSVAVSPGAAAGHEVYTATIENFGLCNAINVVYTDMLPGATTVTFTNFKPGSWDCTKTTSTQVSCTLNQMSGSQASPNNPSTALIAYDVAVPTASGKKPTVVGETHGISVSSDGTDITPGDNSLFLGTLQTSSNIQSFVQDSNLHPTAVVPETVKDNVSPGTFPTTVAQIVDESPSTCDIGPVCANITTENGTLQTVTLERDAGLYPLLTSASAVPVYHELDNTSIFQQLAVCTGHKVPQAGCIVSATTAMSPDLKSSTNPNGLYYVITISTPTNGHWA
jgi:uncharacterized repeat protein (TIGR01451 family)